MMRREGGARDAGRFTSLQMIIFTVMINHSSDSKCLYAIYMPVASCCSPENPQISVLVAHYNFDSDGLLVNSSGDK